MPMPTVENENKLVGPGVEAVALRKRIIAALNEDANKRRKSDAFKAYECLKDRTVNYVLKDLLSQFDLVTVQEMYYAMSNLSILRKVISKLAKVYSNGVKRSMPDKEEGQPKDKIKLPAPKEGEPGYEAPTGQAPEPAQPDAVAAPIEGEPAPVADLAPVIEPENPNTQQIEEMAEYLKLNQVMKKCNRYFRTFKNTLVYVKPIPDGAGKFTLKLEILAPFSYDAIENPDNAEEALAIILSDYTPGRETRYTLGDPATAGRGGGGVRMAQPPVQPTVALDPGAQQSDDKKEYIWWTKGFHFTTNSKGELKPAPQGTTGDKNPIAMLPFVNFADDRDGDFWARGGEDLVDTGVAINTQISNLVHIGISQGHGQLWMTGKDLPKSIKVGPNHAVKLEQSDKDEPEPKIGYLNANPQLGELRSNVEMMLSLMLSTNNLSTHGFSVSLSSGKDFASGIAMILDKSESTEDINEQQQAFRDGEPEVWTRIQAWHDLLGSKSLLNEDVAKLKLPKNCKEVQLDFPDAKPLVSESEELAAIEKRRDLGLNTMLELIMRDNPSLTESEAQQKLDKIKAEKATNAAAFGAPTGETDGGQITRDNGGALNGNPGQEGDGLKPGNQLGNQPNGGVKVKPPGKKPSGRRGGGLPR